jgi:hypothetical protein
VKRILVFLGVVLLLAAIAAAIIPMWVATAGIELSGHGAAAVLLTVLFSFAVGGGLMFLIFYSARKGYDDSAHLGARRPAQRNAQEDGASLRSD